YERSLKKGKPPHELELVIITIAKEKMTGINAALFLYSLLGGRFPFIGSLVSSPAIFSLLRLQKPFSRLIGTFDGVIQLLPVRTRSLTDLACNFFGVLG